MRLLFLSFYYRPDLSAGSFRATTLVEALRACAPPTTHIDVVTTLPNRYATFTREAPQLEEGSGWELRRIRLPRHRNDIAGQIWGFAHYARGVLAHVASRPYDLVFATSSRLMTAALAAWVARRKQARLYLDIRDIFVDTIKDVLPSSTAWAARALFSHIEAWTVRRADRINLVSPGFVGYFRGRYPDLRLSSFTNGVDAEFLTAATSRTVPRDSDGRVRIVYAGNIGDGQALHDILPQFAAALATQARFIVIGDGGRRRQLETALAEARVTNVELRDPLPRDALLEVYRSAHVLFLHLGQLPAFERVLPSKLFEYAALGKPVLAGVAGCAARFVHEELNNAAVFTPGDVDDAVRAYQTLDLVDRPREDFVAKYARDRIADAMAREVLQVGYGG